MIVSKSYAKFNNLFNDSYLKPVAFVKIKGKNGGILCILPNDHYADGREIIIDNEDVFGKEIQCDSRHSFQLLPNLNANIQDNIRDISYFTGRSGSGKTYQAGLLAQEYKKLFPNRRIIYISPQKLERDDVLLKLNPLVGECAGPNAYTNWVDPETRFQIEGGEDKNGKQIKSPFDKSLVIIDDLEGLNDKKVKAGLDNFISSILHTGRHRSISVCFLKHLSTTGKDTKSILNESHYITIFPMANSPSSVDYLLKTYVGLDKEKLKYIKDLRTRWITFHLNNPGFLLTEKELKIFN